MSSAAVTNAMAHEQAPHILWFNEVGMEDVDKVGGKSSSLGEMYQELTSKGVRVPNGFAITADAYHYFMRETDLREDIKKALYGLDVHNPSSLQATGHQIRSLIMSKSLPEDLADAVKEAYLKLSQEFGCDAVDVAVRSSATAEDLPNASFAGQQETFLNVVGNDNILLQTKACIASLFTDRAIFYREQQKFDHLSVGLSVCIQKMVRSDMATSGVMFSIDTESGFKNAVYITGSWGLGENVVQGSVNPDEFYVFKPSLQDRNLRPIISRKLGAKQLKMTYATDPSSKELVQNNPTSKYEQETFCLSDDEVLQLARWAVQIEAHYSAKHGKPTPMDMEWAKDGKTGQLFIVQARPETVHSQTDANKILTYTLKGEGNVIATGKSVGSRIASGKARVMEDLSAMDQFQEGDVLVTDMTDPDWSPCMAKASAIVTNRGGRTCHAAIISRELGVPCVVGCQTATSAIKTGDRITIDCSNGENGFVLEGEVPFEVDEQDVSSIPETRTKMMMILGNPDLAFKLSHLPNSGIGLVRMEFMIMNHIQVHPLALLQQDVLNAKEKEIVQSLTKGYASATEYFVNKLAEGIATIAAAFHPHDVVLRFSDFKSNEYANLVGGSHFEPKEDNPMLGWRGASRYYDEKYKKGFELECEAVKKVRDVFGLTNLVVMIPFLRTVREASRVVETMGSYGLEQGRNGLKVYGMCEVPSNVILAPKFLQVLDGFSIGSNDLTQLTLGIDRDSEIVSHLYDERDEAVKEMLLSVIASAKAAGKYIGICGQAPSDYPELCEVLVRAGITSIALNPDTVVSTTLQVAKIEKDL